MSTTVVSFIHKYKDSIFYFLLSFSLKDCKSVLDVGCGHASPLSKIKKTFYSEGIDIYKKNVLLSKEQKIHDTYKVGDIQKIHSLYKKKSFDVVIALDVIEHLTKKEGLKLNNSLENIARKRVILLTPNGFYHQHDKDNIYEDHKSGWTVQDLKEMGYTVYGLRGLKYLRGEWATIKYKPWLLWGFVAWISEPLLFFYPMLSYHLFAVKNLNEKTN